MRFWVYGVTGEVQPITNDRGESRDIRGSDVAVLAEYFPDCIYFEAEPVN